MPVEIREISIQLTLLAEDAQESGGETDKKETPLSVEMQRNLVNTCVRSVLRILRDKNEP